MMYGLCVCWFGYVNKHRHRGFGERRMLNERVVYAIFFVVYVVCSGGPELSQCDLT